MKTILKNKIQRIASLSAQRLKEWTAQWSDTKKKIALILFCLISTAISTYLILETINSKTAGSAFIHRINIPPHIGKSSEKVRESNFSATDFDRIELVKTYLDSLSTADPKNYGEIMELRPHLMDSIHLFEKLFLLQSKNKYGN
jgi:hypothetical protein